MKGRIRSRLERLEQASSTTEAAAPMDCGLILFLTERLTLGVPLDEEMAAKAGVDVAYIEDLHKRVERQKNITYPAIEALRTHNEPPTEATGE